MKIDWKRVWKEYEKWPGRFFIGAAAEKKIQSLVEAQLKPKRKQK